jgi:hypothetical protein
LALGRLGQDTPGRHHDRSAGAISLDWDSKARVTPAVTLVGDRRFFDRRCDARIFRTIGVRVPNESQEVAWLKLSGGVRSLPQVPWWDAERRAAPSCVLPRNGVPVAQARRGALRGRMKVGAVPHRKMRWLLNSAFRRSAFLSSLRGAKRRSNPGSAAQSLDCFVANAPRNDEVYPRAILRRPGPPPAASDEDRGLDIVSWRGAAIARARRGAARMGVAAHSFTLPCRGRVGATRERRDGVGCY